MKSNRLCGKQISRQTACCREAPILPVDPGSPRRLVDPRDGFAWLQGVVWYLCDIFRQKSKLLLVIYLAYCVISWHESGM